MTAGDSFNLHATAIVIGTRGLLLTGPSGSGKTSLALSLLQHAASLKAYAAFISDDQVFIERHADEIHAICPPSITGLIEVRGTGIGRLRSIERAPLHLAIQVLADHVEERLPPEDEVLDLGVCGSLPVMRLRHDHPAPLIVLAAVRPEFCQESPFRELSLLDF
ncbi:HPr kinase/phosphorylase [Rhizobium sp. FKY42]|uniref:HPr kinase/phosphorylase n=1 Tax=Rhizobium sp. FKY42 TaxID=2562310 RepID=UPI0010C13FFD|nr:HPr kinase/phosphorylase [Rhizobium sp. FKY42]